MSAIFINVGTVVTGALDGSLLVWDLSGTKANFGTCIQVHNHLHTQISTQSNRDFP